MKWTLAKIKEELERLSKTRGDTFSIPVTINGRLTRTLGRVTHRGNVTNGYDPIGMEFSKPFLEAATDVSIIDVIGHEWCHYYITKTTRENHGHDREFKALCATIGVNGGTSTKVGRIVEVDHKYDVMCSGCGKKIGGYSRRCKSTAAIERGVATSKCCDKKATLVQNW